MRVLKPAVQASLVYDLGNGMKPSVAARVYGIGESTVYRMMQRMGIERRPFARWTERDVEILRRHYPAHGGKWDGWERVLPNHSNDSIRQKASKLGIRCEVTPFQRRMQQKGLIAHDGRENA